MTSLSIRLPNVRKLFIPDPGFIIFDCDLDRADLQVVVWEANDEDLKAKLRMGVDLHIANGLDIEGKDVPMEELVPSHPEYPEHAKRYARQRTFAKAFVHGCVTDAHEALTPSGWKPIADISDGEEILVCNIDGSGARFERPSDWFRGMCNTSIIHIRGEAVEQQITFDHKLPYTTTSGKYWRWARACDVPSSASLPKSVIYDGPGTHPCAPLLAALHADGSLDSYGNITFHFKKPRKRERMRLLLNSFHIHHSEREQLDGSVVFYIPHEDAEAACLTTKEFLPEYLHWSHQTAVEYLEEQVHWDGHEGKTKAKWMSSVDAVRADRCHTLAHLHGYGSQRHVRPREDRQTLHQWSLNHRPLWNKASTEQTELAVSNLPVYCPKTSTGFWLTRMNGKISVTGNTNYGGSARTMAANVGITVAQAEAAQRRWFAAHPGIKEWHNRTRDSLMTTRSVWNKFGFRRFYFDRIESCLPEALAFIPQCVPLDHEVLTPYGWMQIKDILPTDRIAVWDPSGTIRFERPSTWNYGEADTLYQMHGLGIYCTENHRVPYYNAGRDTLQVSYASSLPKGARIPRVGMYDGVTDLDLNMVSYMVAFQADGHYDERRDAIQFQFKKERKILRLRQILTDLKVPFTESVVKRGTTCFYIPKGKHQLNAQLKRFGPWLLHLSAKALDHFLLELEFWDGWRSPQGELWYSSSLKENCEWVATIAALRGKRARWLSPDTRSARTNWRITIAPNKGKRSTCSPEKLTLPAPVEVACPTVSTGFFLVKYNDEISVTGNSTVANVINIGLTRIHRELPLVQLLMQVHDSIVGQVHAEHFTSMLPRIQKCLLVEIPYDDPLTIPVGIKASRKSWGECKDVDWDFKGVLM